MARHLALIALSAAVLAVSGCTAAGEAEAETEVEAPAPEVSLPTEEDVQEYLAVDCASIVSADVVKVLHDGGWAAEAQSPWKVGDVTLSDGMLCEWSAAEGDPMSYGWAQGTADEAAQIREWLESEGWTAQEAEGGVVFADPSSTLAYIVGESGEIRFSSTLDGAQAVRAP